MDYIRRLLSTVKMAPTNEELGRRASVYPDEARRPSHAHTEEVVCPVIETSAKLMEYRMLVGITTHHSFKAPRGFNANQRPIITTHGRPAPNKGIYASVVDGEIKCSKAYKFFSRTINACLGLQIIVAAALTALGAANGSHGAVTVFGAINTVIAGFLTYLKGSGLPNRLKYFQHEWAKVREYIEQRERDLSIDHSFDVAEEVATIRRMFEEVRADIEANTPDRFVGTGALRGRREAIVAPGPALAGSGQKGERESSMMGSEAALQGLKEKAGEVRNEVDGIEKEVEAYGNAATGETKGLGLHLVDDISRLKNVMQDKVKEIAQLEKQIVAHGKKALEHKEQALQDGVQDRMKEAGDLEKDVESAGRAHWNPWPAKDPE